MVWKRTLDRDLTVPTLVRVPGNARLFVGDIPEGKQHDAIDQQWQAASEDELDGDSSGGFYLCIMTRGAAVDAVRYVQVLCLVLLQPSEGTALQQGGVVKKQRV